MNVLTLFDVMIWEALSYLVSFLLRSLPYPVIKTQVKTCLWNHVRPPVPVLEHHTLKVEGRL